MRCFYVLKKWSSTKLSLNCDLSLNKVSLNWDSTVCRFTEWPDIINFQNNFHLHLSKIYSNNILNLLSQLLVSGLWPPKTKLLLWEDFSPNATKSSCQIFFPHFLVIKMCFLNQPQALIYLSTSYGIILYNNITAFLRRGLP